MAELPEEELREHLDDVLRRVRAGEDVVVTRDGKPIAMITPPDRPESTMTVNELFARLNDIPYDPTFASDIRKLTGEDDDEDER